MHYFATETGAGTLTLGGTITPQSTANAAFDTYGGAIKTTLTNNPATGIIGAWATTSASNTAATAGSWATNDGSGNIVPYVVPAANIFAAGATVNVSDINANIQFNGGGGLTIPAGTSLNTLLFADPGTAVRTITLNGSLTFANGGGIYKNIQTAAVQHVITGGSITAGTSGPATLQLRTLNNSEPSAAAGPPEAFGITSPITDNAGGGSVTVVKSGYGVLRLNGTNTFTGGLYLNEGQLRPTLAGSMGNGPVYVANGAQILQGAAVDMSNPVFVAGFGPNEGTFSGGAMRTNSANGIFSGTITLTADSGFTSRGGQATTGPGGTWSGKITGPYSLSLNRFSGQGTAGILGNAPTITLTNSDNDWGGDTVIGRGRTRIGGSGEVIPDGAGKGNVVIFGETGSGSILTLDSHSETINGLSAAGDVTLANVTNNVAGNGTLRIGNNNATSTYAGKFVDSTGTISIEKIGTGTLTLTGDSTHTGTTTVTGGTLALSTAGTNNIPNSNVVVGAAGVLNLTDVVGGFAVGSSQTITNNGTVNGLVSLSVGGTANGSGNYASGINLAQGTVSGGATGGTGTLSTSSLTASGGTLLFEFGGANADKITSAGAVNLTGANITFSLIAPANPTTYTLLTGSSITGTPTITNPGSSVGRTHFNLTQTATSITATVTGAPASLTWNNSAPASGDGTSWDDQSNQNWRNGGTPDKFFEADSVTFNDTNNNHYTVNVSGTVKPFQMTVTNNSGDYVLSGGEIAGAGNLIKDGTRALTVSTASTFSGGVTLNQGVLNFASAGTATSGPIGTGTLTINGGTIDNTSGSALTLASNNPQAWAGSFSFAGSADGTHDLNLGTGIISLGASPTLTVNAGTLTVGSIADGTGNSFTKNGAGALVINGSGTYTGATNISAGLVKITGTNFSNQLGAASGVVNISGGATLDIGGITTNNGTGFGAKQFSISGPGITAPQAEVSNGVGAITNSSTNAGQQNAFQSISLAADASIGGPGGPAQTNNAGRFDIRGGVAQLNLNGKTLTKVGTNQFTLVGATVSGGNIVVASPVVTGSPRNILSMETTTSILAGTDPVTTLPYTVTFNDQTNLQMFNLTSANVTRQFVFNGDVLVSNNNTAVSTLPAPIQLNSGSTLRAGGTIAATAAFNPIALNGVISGPGKIVKEGTSTLTLSGNNTYTGTTQVAAGTLQLGASNRIPDGSNMILGDSSIGGSGIFGTAGFSETLGTLTLQVGSTLDLGAGNSTVHFATSNIAALLDRKYADGDQLDASQRSLVLWLIECRARHTWRSDIDFASAIFGQFASGQCTHSFDRRGAAATFD